MEKRILAVLLFATGLAFLLYGGIIFLERQPYEPERLMVFVPAAISFVAGILLNLAWDLFGNRAETFVSDLDPITVMFMFLAAILVLSGLFMPDDRANQAVRLAFSIVTFVVGYEAGKRRRKRAAQRADRRSGQAAAGPKGAKP